LLARFLGPTIKPVLYLEEIQTGSITTRLRSMLEGIDDDAIKGLDWKKFLGSYVVKGKKNMVEYLGRRATLESRADLLDLASVIHEAAAETGALSLPQYSPPPVLELASSLIGLSMATQPLLPGD